MNSLINHKFHGKILHSTRMLTTSLAVLENPSKFAPTDERDSTSFDPLHFMNANAKSKRCTARNTRILHTHLLKTDALHSNVFISNSLLDCYFKSASMDYALRLFDLIPQPNVISWNIMITGYNQNFCCEDSWKIFCRMHSLGFEPSENTYGSVLSACTTLQAIVLGGQVYSFALKDGFASNGYVKTGMIDLFSKNFNFADALKVFHDVSSCTNVVCWNAIISGAVRNGENLIALDIFHQMCNGFLLPNSFTFSSVLTACASLEELEIGKVVQGMVTKYGSEDVFVDTALTNLYAKCGLMGKAVKIFSVMPIRSVVTWTAIISGFVQENDCISALKIFKDMRKLGEEINSYTITSVLNACAKQSMTEEAMQLHAWILKIGFSLDPVIGAALINMYSKIGAADLSAMMFGEMKNTRDIRLWAAAISSFAQNQDSEKAIELFQRMLRGFLEPDEFCTSSVLSVTNCLSLGRQIHCYILKIGLISVVSVASSLFTMYSKCGNLDDSYNVFSTMVDKDCVSWASIISGFVEHGCADQAMQLFREMLLEKTVPDQMTLSAVLAACSYLCSFKKGSEIHGYVFRAGIDKDGAIGGAIVKMYSRCGTLELARRVFEMLPQKDHIARSSLISGYAQYKQIDKAILLLRDVLIAELSIDSFSISSILRATALLNRPRIGTQLHALIMKIGFDRDDSVGSSLVIMYSNCGSIEECAKAFNQIEIPDIISWTSMIVSYAQHGKALEALRVYELMRGQGIEPDEVTFVGVLSACSHSGLVEEAYFYLNSMINDHGIKPGYRHYACMVDLLGRSGRLREAERFINRMPIEPDALIWGTMLAACKVHGDIELGKVAARKVMELEPHDAGAYVSISNICADLGHWEEVINIRKLMKGTGVKKEPGWSFV